MLNKKIKLITVIILTLAVLLIISVFSCGGNTEDINNCEGEFYYDLENLPQDIEGYHNNNNIEENNDSKVITNFFIDLSDGPGTAVKNENVKEFLSKFYNLYQNPIESKVFLHKEEKIFFENLDKGGDLVAYIENSKKYKSSYAPLEEFANNATINNQDISFIITDGEYYREKSGKIAHQWLRKPGDKWLANGNRIDCYFVPFDQRKTTNKKMYVFVFTPKNLLESNKYKTIQNKLRDFKNHLVFDSRIVAVNNSYKVISYLGDNIVEMEDYRKVGENYELAQFDETWEDILEFVYENYEEDKSANVITQNLLLAKLDNPFFTINDLVVKAEVISKDVKSYFLNMECAKVAKPTSQFNPETEEKEWFYPEDNTCLCYDTNGIRKPESFYTNGMENINLKKIFSYNQRLFSGGFDVNNEGEFKLQFSKDVLQDMDLSDMPRDEFLIKISILLGDLIEIENRDKLKEAFQFSAKGKEYKMLYESIKSWQMNENFKNEISQKPIYTFYIRGRN